MSEFAPFKSSPERGRIFGRWSLKALIPLLTLAAIAGPASSQDRASWTRAIEPVRIIDNTYWVGTAGLAAILITTPQGHVLLDGGLPENAPLIEKNIEKLGFKVRDVKVLLNSHAHFDHSGGLAQLKKDTGAQLVAMQQDVYALEKGVYAGSEHMTGASAPPVKVDRIIKDGDTVKLGGVTLTANLTPGHTAGCTTWTWPVKDAGRTLTVAAFCSASVAANRITGPNLQYPGVVEDYRKTFTRAKTMKVDVFLAAHGEFFDLAGKAAKVRSGAPNPFVDPNAFKTFVAGQEREFEATVARARS
jgi:metallo-beta-lactamase class B